MSCERRRRHWNAEIDLLGRELTFLRSAAAASSVRQCERLIRSREAHLLPPRIVSDSRVHLARRLADLLCITQTNAALPAAAKTMTMIFSFLEPRASSIESAV